MRTIGIAVVIDKAPTPLMSVHCGLQLCTCIQTWRGVQLTELVRLVSKRKSKGKGVLVPM